MKVHEVMTREVELISPHHTLEQAAQLMAELDAGILPVSDKDRLVVRSDILADFQGQRTGIKTTYFEHTIGWAHYFYDWLVVRPEIRFDYTSGAKAYDNGTRREQFTFSVDAIVRF